MVQTPSASRVDDSHTDDDLPADVKSELGHIRLTARRCLCQLFSFSPSSEPPDNQCDKYQET